MIGLPTFKKKPEVVDARQFTGGTQNGTDLVFWVQSNRGHAMWIDSYQKSFPETIRLEEHMEMIPVFTGDWIVLKQDGTFTAMRPEVFELTYEQV